MSWDERLFGFAQRAVRRMTSEREDPAVTAAAVDLESHHRHLELFAQLLAGPDIEIRTAEGAGGPAGDVLRLPTRLAATTDPQRNREVLLHRIAFGLEARAAGAGLPPQDDARVAGLATLLSVPAIERRIASRFPGGPELSQTAHWSACVWLLPRVRPDEALPCLELLILGCDPATLAAGFRPEALAWARAANLGLPSPGDRLEAARDLLDALPRRTRPGRTRLDPWGRLDLTATDDRDAGNPCDTAPEPAHQDALPRGDTERAAKIRERITEQRTREDERGDSPLIHVFEKLLTAEEYQGGNRREDGEDELDEHADALDALELRRVVRSSTPTRSIYRAEFDQAGAAPELLDAAGDDGQELLYDEWHESTRSYRDRHCRLRVQSPEQGPPSAASQAWVRRIRQRHARTIREVRADLAHLDRAREPRNRQRSGSEVDVDALVDHLGSVRAAREGHGHAAATDRLYIARRPAHVDLATTILLDTSLSTDAWVDDRRVLDVAREAIVILGEAFGDHELPVAIAAFHSHSRHACRYAELKRAEEPWTKAHSRLHALRPTGYTRIGPALRHATRELAATPARRRLLVLLSDGKPTDHDRYEGRHGIGDVRQAVREARKERVITFALAIDRTARSHLVRMFGQDGYGILADPAGLPRALIGLRARLFGVHS